MAFSLVTGQTVAVDTSSATFPANATAGNLLVAGFNWEGSQAPPTIIADPGGLTNFTQGTEATAASDDLHAQIQYHLTATADDLYAIDWPVQIWQTTLAEFACSETESFDTQNTGTGSSGTTFSTGNITLDNTAAMWLVVGFVVSYSSGNTFSNRTINGVAADGFVNGVDGRTTMFWRFLSTAFSGGNASAQGTQNDHWCAAIIAFKAGTAAAGGTTHHKHLPILGVG